MLLYIENQIQEWQNNQEEFIENALDKSLSVVFREISNKSNIDTYEISKQISNIVFDELKIKFDPSKAVDDKLNSPKDKSFWSDIEVLAPTLSLPLPSKWIELDYLKINFVLIPVLLVGMFFSMPSTNTISASYCVKIYFLGFSSSYLAFLLLQKLKNISGSYSPYLKYLLPRFLLPQNLKNKFDLLFTNLTFDLMNYKHVVKCITEQWIKHVMLLYLLKTKYVKDKPEKHSFDMGLIEAINALYYADRENLPAAADEVISEARCRKLLDVGSEPHYNSSETSCISKKFVWREEFRDRYECFGTIEDGQLVQIQEEPTVIEGEIKKVGLVRKVKGEK